MGAFGSILGGLMSVGGIFMAIWTISTITDNYLVFLLYPIFGVIGGIALGALNSRKARTQEKYKNEYVSYAAMAFAAIVFLSLYYFIFGFDAVSSNNLSELEDSAVVLLAALSGVLVELGLGLVIANSISEDTGF